MLKSTNTKTYKIQQEWRTGLGDNITDISLLVTLSIWFWPGLPAPDTNTDGHREHGSHVCTPWSPNTDWHHLHNHTSGRTHCPAPTCRNLRSSSRRIGISAARAAVLQNLQLSQWRNTTITWNYWLMSHLLYHQMIQPFSEYSNTGSIDLVQNANTNIQHINLKDLEASI